MSPKAREAPQDETPQEAKLTDYRVILRPPEGHPRTFMGQHMETNPETGQDEPVEIEREYLMDMTVPAKSEEAAKLYAERHAFNLAVQEAGTDDPDEVLAKQWVVESVREDKPPEE